MLPTGDVTLAFAATCVAEFDDPQPPEPYLAMEAHPVLPGALDMLILRALSAGRDHVYAIGQRLRQTSSGVIALEESVIFDALQRLLFVGWVKSEPGVTDNNRSAQFYSLTMAGEKRLDVEIREFELTVAAMRRVLETA